MAVGVTCTRWGRLISDPRKQNSKNASFNELKVTTPEKFCVGITHIFLICVYYLFTKKQPTNRNLRND